MLRLFVLVLIAIGSGGVSWWLLERDTAQSQQHSAGKQLLADIASTASDIQRVKIEDQNGVLFSAVKDSDRWLATHLDTIMTFPADTKKLAELANQLMQLKVLEPKTANPERYTRLGVENVRDSGSQSVLIELGGRQDVFSLLVGRSAVNGRGSYVRQPEEATSLLVDKYFSLPEQTAAWLSSEILPWEADDVRRIAITRPQSPLLEINKSDEQPAKWQVSQPEQTTFAAAESEALTRRVTGLLNFEFNSVKPYLPQTWSNIAEITRIDIEGQEGEILTLLLAFGHGDDFVQLRIETQSSGQWFTEWEFGLTEYQAAPFLFPSSL